MTGREIRAVWYQGESEADSCNAQDLGWWIAKHGREPDAFGLYRNEFDGTQTHERDFPRTPVVLFKSMEGTP